MPSSITATSDTTREKPEQTTVEQEIGGPYSGLDSALPLPVKDTPRPLTPANILAMQKTVGNRAVLRMLEQQKKNSVPKPKSASPTTVMRDDDDLPDVGPVKPKGSESSSKSPSDDFDDESSLLDDDEPTEEEPSGGVKSPG